jgi:hypothetical protein
MNRSAKHLKSCNGFDMPHSAAGLTVVREGASVHAILCKRHQDGKAVGDITAYCLPFQRQGAVRGNYARGPEQGYPVGSGLVERAVAHVINGNMKQQGMRWKRATATAVVALPVQRINADWDAA